MAKTYKNLIYSNAEYTLAYPGFRGVELNASSSITSPSRLSYAENMYRDYESDGADVIESIPGFRKLFSCNKQIHALYLQRSSSHGDHVIVHAGDQLWRFPIEEISKSSPTLGDPIASVSDAKSLGFSLGLYFYIIDGARILRISEDGKCNIISNDDVSAYVPTTFVSGERYEERNLLTDSFKEEFYVIDPSGYYYSTGGIKYTITDSNNQYCSVSGIDENEKGHLSIPAYVDISGIEYKVTSIDSYAFSQNSSITSVSISEGISRIGLFAFKSCVNVTEVVIPSSVAVIENGAFIDCASLKRVYLGAGVTDIGLATFANCQNIENVYYALDKESYDTIKNISGLNGKNIIYESKHSAITIAFNMHDQTNSVDRVCINGESCEFTAESRDGSVKFITLHFNSPADATGIKIEVYGTLAAIREDFDKTSENEEDLMTGYEAIAGCRIAEAFDGRIFFSGNPRLPNTVFYTESKNANDGGELYIGKYNYFNDGVGRYNVKSMLATRDMLAIFKEGDDGSGSVFYHKAASTSSDTVSTIYPTAYVHSGICAEGNSHSFLDDPVFITQDGLYALESPNINYQRNVVCRSHNVNFKLLKENLGSVNLCSWLGYLVVGVNGKMYLADSRSVFTHPSGSKEYEWFYISGIGTYKDDEAVYRYAPQAHADAISHASRVGEAVDFKSVFSATDSNGTLYYYVVDDGVKYHVYPTEERTGGVLSPATVFLSHGKLLFFATESGDICVFNNDKRGVAPDSIKESEGYDQDVYAMDMANRIHPSFYSFAGHAPRYEVRTALDNCGIPHLTKNTVKNSLVIKARAYISNSIKCEAVTDRGDRSTVGYFPAVDVGFDNFSFDTPPWTSGRYTSSALPEREKRWIEKQIVLSSEKFCSPISIHSITYRYQIKGKIKNNA